MRPSTISFTFLLVLSVIGVPITKSHEQRGFGSELKTQITNTAKIAMSRIDTGARQSLEKALNHLESDPHPLVTLSGDDADVLISAADRGDVKVIMALNKAVKNHWAGEDAYLEVGEAGTKVFSKFEAAVPEGKEVLGAEDLREITHSWTANKLHLKASLGKAALKDWIFTGKQKWQAATGAAIPEGMTAVDQAAAPEAAVIRVEAIPSHGEHLAKALNLPNIVGSDEFEFPIKLTEEQMGKLKVYIAQDPRSYTAVIKDIKTNILDFPQTQFRELENAHRVALQQFLSSRVHFGAS